MAEQQRMTFPFGISKSFFSESSFYGTQRFASSLTQYGSPYSVIHSPKELRKLHPHFFVRDLGYKKSPAPQIFHDLSKPEDFPSESKLLRFFSKFQVFLDEYDLPKHIRVITGINTFHRVSFLAIYYTESFIYVQFNPQNHHLTLSVISTLHIDVRA